MADGQLLLLTYQWKQPVESYIILAVSALSRGSSLCPLPLLLLLTLLLLPLSVSLWSFLTLPWLAYLYTMYSESKLKKTLCHRLTSAV